MPYFYLLHHLQIKGVIIDVKLHKQPSCGLYPTCQQTFRAENALHRPHHAALRRRSGDGVHPLNRGYLEGYIPLIRSSIATGTVKS